MIILKWLFNILLLMWLYHALIRPLLVRHFSQSAHPPFPPPPSGRSQRDEGEYIDYEEVK